MDVKKIKALAEIMETYGLTSLKADLDGSAIELERKQEIVYPAPAAPTYVPMAGGMEFTPPVSGGLGGMDLNSAPSANGSSLQAQGTVIPAPLVGVFYSAPSPESDSFVEVGSRVNKGDVLCIIEAMKLMNEITSEYDGIITEICAENGDVVEAGQPLYRMEIKE